MRVVLDTNVVVSAFLSPTGTPAQILARWENQEFDLIISEPLLREYQRALNYERVEERVARDIILEADAVVNIVDAVHLERDLFLTLQLIDM
ncbi:MAG: putative toxin-antitoxin system toxin component, PIN family, partial [Actinobacteria bacterium]|nr:putative toxin-antitoxin system toxin component, PIN family [Actinomycetota bacterium]